MNRTASRIAVLAGVVAGAMGATATTASAGGIGDFLSPAFGTTCGNHHNGATAAAAAPASGGSAGGNVTGVPVLAPANQCGGADLTAGGSGLINNRNIPISVPIDADLLPV
ncbi:hypothetical protein ACPCSC_13885 [Streptomyces lavendulocolor]|uniref:hypothetical protein n=1 Tax=Streptomyces lavendulocolor TaxID=67316 RepID=UPI003C2B5A80